jgi:hypothetical protein
MGRLATMVMMWMAAACCLAGEATYELAMDFSVDGTHVSSPRLVVKDGVTSTVEMEGRFIDVLVRGMPEGDRVAMSFWIGETAGGERRIVATPSAVTVAGMPVVLKVMVEDPRAGMRELAVGVTVEEKSE